LSVGESDHRQKDRTMATQGIADDHQIEVHCPGCEAPVRIKLGAARKSPTVPCGNGHEIKIDAKHLDQELRELDLAMDRLRRSIGGQG
jgi:hypothetical protein